MFDFDIIVWFQKVSILPPQGGLEIPGRRGVYEAKLEFPEGWVGGGHRANPFSVGHGYFLEPRIPLYILF